MSELTPRNKNLHVIQSVEVPTRTTLAKLDGLIVVAPKRIPAKLWRKIPGADTLTTVSKRVGTDKSAHTRLGNRRATGVWLRRIPVQDADKRPVDTYGWLRWAAGVTADALADQPRQLGIVAPGLDDETTDQAIAALLLAIAAHDYHAPDFRHQPPKRTSLRSVRLMGLPRRLDITRVLAEARAINLARWLTALPANLLTARTYRDVLAELATECGWQSEFFGLARLRKLGAGAFLAVAHGNADRDAGIVRLKYRPPGSRSRPKLALVGKGIIFDTGGNNLKTFKSMLDMHQDMGGSAVAVATLQALTDINFPHPVDCWLAITENRIGPTAYKSRDVVTALNGTSIEVIHTDAEGRMALADTLTLAGREDAGLIIDYATLTGACHYALSDRYSGVFTNHALLNNVLIEAGRESGERVWPFPMDADFDEDLKSEIADIAQCATGGEADQILAARFLQRFTPKQTPWVHIDLSAVTRKGGLGQVPGGLSGFGVRWTLNLLHEQAGVITQALGDGLPVARP